MNTGFPDQYATRRRSFSGGYLFPPHSNARGYPRNGFNNDLYDDNFFQEVSGPRTYPPGSAADFNPNDNSPLSDNHSSGHTAIKFHLMGSTHSGVSVNQAIERVRLSQATVNPLHDISVDMSGKMKLRVKWTGYRSNMYNIPLSTEPRGYVDVQSLARRTATAIAHFMETNFIALSYDRVVIHRLEEISLGVWTPVLTH